MERLRAVPKVSGRCFFFINAGQREAGRRTRSCHLSLCQPRVSENYCWSHSSEYVGWGGESCCSHCSPPPHTKDEHFAFQQRAQEALELSITTRLGLSKTTPILCKLQPLPTAFVSVGCCGAACSLAFQRSDPTLTAARTDSSGKTRRWHEGSSVCDLLNLECEQWSSRNAESLIQRLCKAVRALLWHPVGSVRSP